MANTFGIEYKSPADIITETQQGFQRALQSGNPDQMRAAIMQQTAFALGGTPELRQARKTEQVLQAAGKDLDKDANDIQQQKQYYAAVIEKAEEQGLPEVAMQARNNLVTLESVSLERDNLRARTEGTQTQTEAVRSSVDRNRTKRQNIEEAVRLEAQRDRLPEDGPAREAVQRRIDFLQARNNEIDEEFERNKRYTLKDVQVTGPDGEPWTVTMGVNQADPTDTYELGRVKTAELEDASGRSGRGRERSATVEKIADNNRLLAQAHRKNMVIAQNVAEATKGLEGRGLKREMRSVARKLFGTEDMAEVNKKLVNEALTTRSLGLLPPGPASDKDVALVLNTQLSDTADPEAIRKSMAAWWRLSARDKIYTDFIDQYLVSNPDGSMSIGGAETAFKEYYAENQEKLEAQLMADSEKLFGLTPAPGTASGQIVRGSAPSVQPGASGVNILKVTPTGGP